MTVKNLKDKLANKEFHVNACNIFTRLRNSKPFWNNPRNDINCMIQHYGPATWFLTFSPSEYHWEDLDKYLRDINGAKAHGKSTSALIAMDPISSSDFHQGPLGKVAHIDRAATAKHLKNLEDDKTGGLPDNVSIKVGCKEMLRTNHTTDKGLVNGAIGIVKDIISENGSVK